jgi:tetratricopeptide (TPR) repeat protein
VVVVSLTRRRAKTRDYCIAAFLNKSCATHCAARPDPIRSLALSQGRLFTAQRTLVQDDKQTHRLPVRGVLEFRASTGGHYSREYNEVSSTRATTQCLVLALLLGAARAVPQAQGWSAATGAVRQIAQAPGSGDAKSIDLAQLFQRGQDALTHGRLDEAERDFRQVLEADPKSGAAYANLGVVYMRRKQWTRALETLHKAEQMMPQVAGIRLNIGLAYYRQNEFLKAIAPFESVVRDEPDAVQPRYLLGLCYFFAERWADAATTLEPLWTQESGQLAYLYVLSNAAHRAGQKELDERAATQLIKLGDGSPEYRLFVGKYHLNLDQFDMALQEFEAAAAENPNLPFVHFNLGLTYLKKQDFEHARDEFLKDIAVEPDLALDYDELGDVYSLMQQDASAERSYREALRRDARLVNSHLGLAKIYQRQEKYAQALTEINAAGRLDSTRIDTHYLRGQVLVHMGRKEEGKKELETAVRIDNERRAERQKHLETETVPSPELLQDPE